MIRISDICDIPGIVNMRHIDYVVFMARETAYPVKKLVNLTDEQAKRISDFRFDQRLQSENAAIRRLIELGLEAIEKDRPSGQ